MEPSVRLLFVDDEPLVLMGLQRMLHPYRNEWAVSYALDAREALERVEDGPCDVVVADLKMPHMNGLELLREVRRRHPQCVRILLSGQCERTVVLSSVGAAHQYLAKPCDAGVLRDVVQRLARLRRTVDNPDLRRLLTSLEALPTLSRQHKALTDELESDASSMTRIAELVARDVGLSAKVLQVVNSSFFGLPRDVATAREAVPYLGLDFLRSLVVSEHLFAECGTRSVSRRVVEGIRNRSLEVSAAAGRIARELGLPRDQVDMACSAGMLHLVGLLALQGLQPSAYRRVERMAATMPWHEAESRVMQVTHAEIGAYLMGLWGLPPQVVEAIELHRSPRRSRTTQAGPLVALHIAATLGRPDDEVDWEAVEALSLRERVQAWRAACGGGETS